MNNNIKLLTDYHEFSQVFDPEDFAQFGEWLKQKYTDSQDYLTSEEDINDAGLDVISSYLLGNMTRYVDIWIKLAFHDLPLVSLGDFGILRNVEFHQNPTKKMVSDNLLMERTTCMESIKRMVKEGLLEEEVDQKDRRMRRVHLTTYGQEMMRLSTQKMRSLSKLFMGNLSEPEKKSLLPPLKKLLQFHEYMYREKGKEEVKDLYDL